MASFPADQLQLLIDSDDSVREKFWHPTNDQCIQWVGAALSASLPDALWSQTVEVSLNSVTADNIQALNAEFRDANKPTNVLSFPADMPLIPSNEPEAAATAILGDVVVCPEVLVSEATLQAKPIENHWAHMIVHSVLHLNGLDHEDENSAEAMESLEIRILSDLGINNPYVSALAK